MRKLLEPYEGTCHEEVTPDGTRYSVRDDGSLRILLIPIATDHQARTALVRWLALYTMLRRIQPLVATAKRAGTRAAQREGYKRGIFID